jgi:hypothetical protein
MDTPTLLGTGFVILAAFVWFFCAYLAWQTAGKRHRQPGLWAVLGVIFGPFALFAVFLLPPGHVEGHHDKKVDKQAALYEVPKKKH